LATKHSLFFKKISSSMLLAYYEVWTTHSHSEQSEDFVKKIHSNQSLDKSAMKLLQPVSI
jgi:hypothetical protein